MSQKKIFYYLEMLNQTLVQWQMLALCLKQQQMTGRISCSTIDFLGMV